MPVDAVSRHFDPTLGKLEHTAKQRKLANWNILRASVFSKMREIIYARANMVVFVLYFAFSRLARAIETARMAVIRRFLPNSREYGKFPRLSPPLEQTFDTGVY